MQARIEFPTTATFDIEVIKHMAKTPADEAIFWKKLSLNKYTLDEELCILKCLESLEFEVESIQGCALGLLGGLYAFTQKSYQDIKEGLKHIQDAVTRKNTNAMVNLGHIYKEAHGVSRDMLKAKALYEEAAALNNSLAKHCLAMMYLTGFPYTDTIDTVKAAILFRESVSVESSENELKKLRDKYPTHDLIQYHCIMALDPKSIGSLFDKKPLTVSEFILNDSLIKEDKDKYKVFIKKIFQLDQYKMRCYALSASDSVRMFLVRHMIEESIEKKSGLNPYTAPLLRKCFSSSNEQIKNALQSLKNDHPRHDGVLYHYTMAIEPSSLNELFDKLPKAIGYSIFYDDFLNNQQKYNLFFETLFEYNLQKLATYALSASSKIRQFIAQQIVKNNFNNASEASLSLRKLHATSPEEAKPQLQLLKKSYPNEGYVQYNCAMALEPHNLNSLSDKSPELVAVHLCNDKQLSDDEKYAIFSMQLFNSDDKLVLKKLVSYAFSAPKPIQSIILEKLLIKAFGSIANAAFELRKSYPSKVKVKSKLDLLMREYPNNLSVQYHYKHALGSLTQTINILYDKSPLEISKCILQDELLMPEEKYALFICIVYKSDLEKAPFSENVLDFMSEQETLQREKTIDDLNKTLKSSVKDKNMQKQNVSSNTTKKETVKVIGNFTCTFDYNSPKSLLFITSDDDKAQLIISHDIADNILACDNLSDLAKIIRSDAIMQKNAKSVVNELADLMDQYAIIFSDYSEASSANITQSNLIETATDDVRSIKSTAKSAQKSINQPPKQNNYLKDNKTRKEEQFLYNQFEEIRIENESTKRDFKIEAELILNNSEAQALFWSNLGDNKYTEEEEWYLLNQFEECIMKDESTRGSAFSLAGGIYAFTINAYKNVQKGLNYLQKAAALNNSDAMVTLSVMYEMGKGVAVDPIQAIQHLEQAAALNNPMAKYNLGIMYFKGFGDKVEKDLIKAASLFRDALPLKQAQSKLNELNEQNPHHALIQYYCQMALNPQGITINKLYETDPKISDCILNDFNLSEEQKYQFFVEITHKSDLEKYPLPEKLVQFMDSHESKEVLATPSTHSPCVETSTADTKAVSKVHSNITFAFDEVPEGILLLVTSKNKTHALFVSDAHRTAIFNCNNLFDVLALLQSPELRKINNIDEIYAVIESIETTFKELESDIKQENSSSNTYSFFKKSSYKSDSELEDSEDNEYFDIDLAEETYYIQ